MRVFIFPFISLCISIITGYFVIKFCHKHRLYDTINNRKVHTGNIPRLGGIAIIISNSLSYILYSAISNKIIPLNFIFLISAGFIIFIFGILDDLIELKAKTKLVIQIIAALIVVFAGFRFTQFFNFSLEQNLFTKVLSSIITVFWIVGLVNAYNLIDGIDGLCGSITFITCITYGFIFYGSSLDITEFSFILSAAILGFLFYNWPPAKTFMGDNGSQSLGFFVAVIALYNERTLPDRMITFEFNKILIVLNLAALPIIDTIAAIWRRLREHRPIMSPDKAHIHHKLMNIGFNRKQILFILLGIQTLVCGVVYFSTYLRPLNAMAVLITSLAFMAAFFSFIHFANRAAVRKVREKNTEILA